MIFVDTWAWLALAHRRDPYHSLAVQQHRDLQVRNERYCTTDFVLAETMAPLFSALDFTKAKRFMSKVFKAVRAGTYDLIFVSSDQFNRAWEMRQKYSDKPDISFVDFISMVVMQDLGIAEVFSGDQHFVQVNLGFRLVP